MTTMRISTLAARASTVSFLLTGARRTHATALTKLAGTLALLTVAAVVSGCSHHAANRSRGDSTTSKHGVVLRTSRKQETAAILAIRNSPRIRPIIDRMAPRCREDRLFLAVVVYDITTALQKKGVQASYADTAKGIDRTTASVARAAGRGHRIGCGPTAGLMVIGLNPNRATVVSPEGRIGKLRVDVSTRADIRRLAGAPNFIGEGATSHGSFEPPRYEILGYVCSRSRERGRGLDPGGGQPAHLFCRTVYFINAKTGKLVSFWTDSKTFRTAKGSRPGMRESVVDRLERSHPYIHALTGFERRTRAATLFVENAGCKPGANLNASPCLGGRVRTLILEGQHPVGLLEDAIPNA
jgi:hypothetical protein